MKKRKSKSSSKCKHKLTTMEIVMTGLVLAAVSGAMIGAMEVIRQNNINLNKGQKL